MNSIAQIIPAVSISIGYKISVSLEVSSISLIINQVSYPLEQDPSGRKKFVGQINIIDAMIDDQLYVEIRGTSPHNDHYITGNIDLLEIGGKNLGNYDFVGIVIINNFRCVVGNLSLNGFY